MLFSLRTFRNERLKRADSSWILFQFPLLSFNFLSVPCRINTLFSKIFSQILLFESIELWIKNASETAVIKKLVNLNFISSSYFETKRIIVVEVILLKVLSSYFEILKKKYQQYINDESSPMLLIWIQIDQMHIPFMSICNFENESLYTWQSNLSNSFSTVVAVIQNFQIQAKSTTDFRTKRTIFFHWNHLFILTASSYSQSFNPIHLVFSLGPNTMSIKVRCKPQYT